MQLFAQDMRNRRVFRACRILIRNHFFTQHFHCIQIAVQRFAMSLIPFFQISITTIHAVVFAIDFAADFDQLTANHNHVLFIFCHLKNEKKKPRYEVLHNRN